MSETAKTFHGCFGVFGVLFQACDSWNKTVSFQFYFNCAGIIRLFVNRAPLRYLTTSSVFTTIESIPHLAVCRWFGIDIDGSQVIGFSGSHVASYTGDVDKLLARSAPHCLQRWRIAGTMATRLVA